MDKYYPPSYEQGQFHCIHCGVYARQKWGSLYFQNTNVSNFKYSHCEHCNRKIYWYRGKMVVPDDSPMPRPHEDLPEACLEEYQEARRITEASPRAATALLRICLQRLFRELGESGTDLEQDVDKLIARGLPDDIQSILEYCRLIGPNAVTPGVIEPVDGLELAQSLFLMINFLVAECISKNRQIDELYQYLPEARHSEENNQDQD